MDKFVSRKFAGTTAAVASFLAVGAIWPACVVACVGLLSIAIVDIARIRYPAAGSPLDE